MLSTVAQVAGSMGAAEVCVGKLLSIALVGPVTNAYTTTGRPRGVMVPGGGLAGVALDASQDLLGVHNVVGAGEDEIVLSRLRATVVNTNAVPVMLVDRLWHNSGIDVTVTTSQTVDSVSWPARDRNGATAGDGVYLALELSAAATNGTYSVTVTYTNSLGVSGRVASEVVTTTLTTAGRFQHIALQAGDTGVQSVQSVQLSASLTAGALSLVAFRPIAFVPAFGLNVASTPRGAAMTWEDVVSLCAPRIKAGAVVQAVWSVMQISTNSLASYEFALARG